jgi:phage terminase small subunit
MISKNIKLPKTPTGLRTESAKFWRDTVKIFEFEQHHLKLLEAACRCWDRILEDREILEKEGKYFLDRYKQPKPHPALDDEKRQKNLFMRLIRELCLDAVVPDESRPPRLA